MKKMLPAFVISTVFAAPAMADVRLFGSVEQQITYSNSEWNTDNAWDDSYIGVKVTEDFGNGVSAFGVMSLNIGSDTNNGGEMRTRDLYLGFSSEALGTATVGQMLSITATVGDRYVDIFEGPSQDVRLNYRVPQMISYYSPSYAGLSVAASSMVDGNDTHSRFADAYELAAFYNLGSFSTSVVYAVDNTNKSETTVGGSYSFGDATVGATYEKDYGWTVAGAYNIGNNVLRAGYQNDDDAKTWTVEAAHNFSKNVSAYVNYQDESAKTSTVASFDAVTVGARMMF